MSLFSKKERILDGSVPFVVELVTRLSTGTRPEVCDASEYKVYKRQMLSYISLMNYAFNFADHQIKKVPFLALEMTICKC